MNLQSLLIPHKDNRQVISLAWHQSNAIELVTLLSLLGCQSTKLIWHIDSLLGTSYYQTYLAGHITKLILGWESYKAYIGLRTLQSLYMYRAKNPTKLILC